jgi:hypothetical protein
MKIRHPAELHVDNEGQVSVLVAIVALGIGIGTCFTASVGEKVNEKIRVQNAADSIAYSNGLWMARGMNAVTACNHLMGELTALIVIHESLGGPERDLGKTFENEQSRRLSRVIESLRRKASYPPQPTGFLPFHQADDMFVNTAVKAVERQQAQGRHLSGAAIFDAQYTLKYEMAACLALKNLNRLLNQTATALMATVLGAKFGIALEIFADASHLYANKLIFDLAKEAVFLHALDLTLPALGTFKTPTREILIPAISQYGDSLIGVSSSFNGTDKTLISSPINWAHKKTGEQLSKKFGLYAIAQHPEVSELSLPVQPEEIEKTSSKSSVPSLWRGEKAGGQARHLVSEFEKVSDRLASLARFLQKIEDTFEKISWVIPERYRKKYLAVLDIVVPIPPVEVLVIFSEKDRPNLKELSTLRYNPTLERLARPENQFDWQSEQYSQWTRATYPYVDSYRTSMRKFFSRVVPNSGLATFYTHWTNRLTLVEVHQRRRQSFNDSANSSAQLDEAKTGQKAKNSLLDIRKTYITLVDNNTNAQGIQNRVDLEKLASRISVFSSTYNSGPEANVLKRMGIPTTNWLKRGRQLVIEAKRRAGDVPYPGDSNSTLEEFREASYILALKGGIAQFLADAEVALQRIAAYANPLGPPHMFVMKDSSPQEKGLEPWATGDRNLADERFTILVAASLARKPSSFAPGLFTQADGPGTTCFSQAMIYNANGRDLTVKSEHTQPNSGWDTLNWTPTVKAPEWSRARPTQGGTSSPGSNWPWEITLPTAVFTGQPNESFATVKPNWQCKLTPITRHRLRGLLDNEQSSEQFSTGAEIMYEFGPTHSH